MFQFSQRVNTNMLPTLSGTPFPDMQNIEFTIQKLLNCVAKLLKANKASGPDKIVARFLRDDKCTGTITYFNF